MAVTVALINMKGGVGKSTLAVNLAHQYAISPWRRRILVVDLDPQFNASQYLIGQAKYEKAVLVDGGATTWDILEQNTRTPGRTRGSFDVRDSIVPVRRFTSGARVDLIPSRLELALSLRNPAQKESLLAKSLGELEDDYDLIIIDCPPTDSILSDAAYLAADYILVPVKPEYLSSIGLPLLNQSLDEFKVANPQSSLKVAGIVFNATDEYSPEEDKAKQDVRRLARQLGWKVFKSDVPYSRSFPKGARETRPIFSTSYARTTVADRVKTFANDFAKAVGL